MSTAPPIGRPPVLPRHDTLRARDTTYTLWMRGTLFGLLLLIAWDASGLDLPLARLFGTSGGFSHRNGWWMTQVLHDGARNASWALTIFLAATVVWPLGAMRQLSRADRIGMLLGMLASVAAVSLLKQLSSTSCPWDLTEFGGTARYVSHWRWWISDGGGGHCFPAGHASAGFAYLGGWFWLRRAAPKVSVAWLIGALLLGLALGLVQQIRGAHYMSHTLWTAWLCWTVSGAVWWMQRRRSVTHIAHSS